MFSVTRIPATGTDDFTGTFVSADIAGGTFVASIDGSPVNVFLGPSTRLVSRWQGQGDVLDELSRGAFLDALPTAVGSIGIRGFRMGSSIESSLVVITR